MTKTEDKRIIDELKYSARRKYIGEFSATALSDAASQLKRGRCYNKPLQSADVHIGKIDGDVICNALWREMSCNPVRFGDVSPFVFAGHNNIFKFCETYNGNDSVLQQIRDLLIDFMRLNRNPNTKSWRDVIYTSAGNVSVIIYDDGHFNHVYRMLADLRDCIKVIAGQNVADFKAGNPYRDAIIKKISKQSVRPDCVMDNSVNVTNNNYYQMTIFNEIEYAGIEQELKQAIKQQSDCYESIKSMRNWISENRSYESPAEIRDTEEDIQKTEQNLIDINAHINDLKMKRANYYINLIKQNKK